MDIGILKESETRYNLIDPSIKKARWNLADRTQIWFEVPVERYDASPEAALQITVCFALMVKYLQWLKQSE